MARPGVRIHPSADVSDLAEIGEGTSIWNQCQIREGARIGKYCILSKDVYIDSGVKVGDNVKIQNGVSVYTGVVIEDGVFCGPHCVFTNDKFPRAVNSDGSPKTSSDWTISHTLIKHGSSIGANATIVCGVTLGEWCMVGAGAVVTRDVPAYGLVIGNPATLVGYACSCGHKLSEGKPLQPGSTARCGYCNLEVHLPANKFDNEK